MQISVRIVSTTGCAAIIPIQFPKVIKKMTPGINKAAFLKT